MNQDKRWRAGDERWRAPEHGVFDPSRYSADVLSRDEAKAFVEREHYSSSFPAWRFSAGLYGPGPALVGVAVFSQPTHEGFLPKWTGFAKTDAVELGRFVLLDSVAFNAESWFLRRAFQHLRREKPAIAAVASCADPMQRTSAEGLLTKPAHFGTIYQASNAKHVGRTKARRVYVAPDGTVLNERMLCKVKAEDTGWRYGAEALLRYGAPERRPHEDLAAWLARALASPVFRRLRHPGNLVYTFGLTKAGTRALDALHGHGLPYVKAA